MNGVWNNSAMLHALLSCLQFVIGPVYCQFSRNEIFPTHTSKHRMCETPEPPSIPTRGARMNGPDDEEYACYAVHCRSSHWITKKRRCAPSSTTRARGRHRSSPSYTPTAPYAPRPTERASSAP